MGRVIPRRNEKIAWTSFDRDINPAATGILTGFTGLRQGVGLDIVPSVNLGGRRDHLTAVESTHADPSLDHVLQHHALADRIADAQYGFLEYGGG